MRTIEIEDCVREFLDWGTRLQSGGARTARDIAEEFVEQFVNTEVVDTQMEHNGVWDALRFSFGVSSPWVDSHPRDLRQESSQVSHPYDDSFRFHLSLERGIAIAYFLPDSDGESQSYPTLMRLDLFFETTSEPHSVKQLLVEKENNPRGQLEQFSELPPIASFYDKIPIKAQTSVDEIML